jgi:hypothetical protein
VWNDNLSPVLYDWKGIDGAMWFGFAVCVMSLVSCLLLIIIDKRTVKQLEANNSAQNMPEAQADAPVECSDILGLSKLYWLITFSCVIVYGAVLPFNGVVAGILSDRFGVSNERSGTLMSIPFIISAVSRCEPCFAKFTRFSLSCVEHVMRFGMSRVPCLRN